MTVDRYAGCVLGQCVGDALGFVVEGHPSESCRAYVDGVLRAGRAGDFGRPPFPFGQVTDDSQLAYALLESLVEKRELDPADYASRVAELFAKDQIVGRGRATEEAAMRLARGVPWNEAGTPAPSAGNGAAMRAAPIGLFHPRDAARRREAARTQSVVTHRDPRSAAGAIAIAEAVALVLHAPPSLPSFTEAIAEAVREDSAELADAIVELASWVPLEPSEVVARVRRVGLPPDHREQWPGISPFVMPSVLWSLYSFLRSPDDYWETICTAIAVGGDVDTTAAMAGAISGAHLGEAALPAHLVARIHDRERWTADDARRLAERAHAIAADRR